MFRHRTVVFLGTIAVFGSIAVGCSTPEAGTPTSQATQSSTSSPPSTAASTGTTQPLPFAGAPKVTNPVEAKKFVDDPCLLLTPAQMDQLEVGQGKLSSSAFGMACQWAGRDINGSSINVSFNTRTHDGLSAVYRSKEQGNFESFEPVPDVEGFPAVFAEPSNSPEGSCTIFVGVSDEVAFQLGLQQSTQKVGTVQPCKVTKAVASLLLQTMEAGS